MNPHLRISRFTCTEFTNIQPAPNQTTNIHAFFILFETDQKQNDNWLKQEQNDNWLTQSN